ncbi:MAG TPA: hypothetical protein VMX38_18770 [Verrucomicrobiae bacterium]|nr:hypothetical protein [Verrucomicrobiae bacterium]
MKKVSTAATTESRNFSRQQKLTIGLDLGDRHSWYCVLDETGTVQLEQRVRTNAKTLRPTCTERTNRTSRVRIEAWRQWLLGGRKNLSDEQQIF